MEAGDEAAGAVFLDRHRGAVWRLLRAACRSEQEAEEALQESFLAVFRAPGAFAGPGSARPWLLGVARRQAARTWRRRSGEPMHAEALDGREEAPLVELGVAAGWGEVRDPEARVSAMEDHARLHRALDALSPADREVITLRDLEGLSGPEAAQVLDLPLASLKTRLHRARLRLLARLREEESR